MRLFKSYSEREVKRIIKKYIKKINKLEEEISKLSDEELKEKTNEFKNRLNNKETLDDILPEAFAVCREASNRILGMRHYDVQLIGGIVLHQGRIAEMKTGEGKTLVATLPAYLNALTGKGVHIVTVNDYLAERDSQLMKPLYNFLGISCDVIVNGTSQEVRREIYKSDIVYITNNELGFDYLRDNMALKIEDKVQRPLNFCIVDEVDSILIDEARTPLIITQTADKPTDLYKIADTFVNCLVSSDYSVDEKMGAVTLTDSGIEKVEKIFGIENYADIEHNDLRHHINQSLKANYHMVRDKDYLVKDGELLIIDEFTGRIADGRRFSKGLHQALEAKEGLKIKPESHTLATITYQNFFRLYKKLSGMTGTAETEQEEFNTTYALDVIVIPTNKPVIRKDLDDKIYATEEAKIRGIVKDIKKCYKKGRPVLVGTSSISKSEILSERLKEEDIPHQVLNAKYHEQEAEIIANAGQLNAVTIATNMAGRGTDIKLGEGVADVGGLKVIGTERAENRRVDNQLIGRSGRQGDPGASQFYLSFEDKLIQIYAPENLKDLINKFDKEDEKPIKNKFTSKIVNRAQKQLESSHFQARKTTLEYDDVVNKQREIIYTQRDEVLNGVNIYEQVKSMIESVITYIIETETNAIDDNTKIDINDVIKAIEPEYMDSGTFNLKEIESIKDKVSYKDEVTAYILEKAMEIFDKKISDMGEEAFNNVATTILLTIVDENWRSHLDVMDELKRDVKLLAYKQQNPIQEYIMKSSEIFSSMIMDIKMSVVKYILKLNVYNKSQGTPIKEEINEKSVDENPINKEPVDIEINGMSVTSKII